MNRAALRVALGAALLSIAAAPSVASAQSAAAPMQPPEPSSGARTITLDEAVSLATGQSVQVQIGQEAITSAELDVRSTKTYRLPTLGVSANLFVWDSAYEIQGFGVLREQVTSSVDVTLAQPITGAFLLGRYLDLEKAAVDVAKAELDTTKLDLAFQTAQLYVTALQAQTLKEISETSVAQFEANLTRVRALRDAGIAFDVDVLHLEAQRDAMAAQALEAESGSRIAANALVLLLSLDPGTTLTVAPIDTTPPPLQYMQDEAVAAARAKRPEFNKIDKQIEQTEVAIDVVKAQYIPTVNAIARYTHTEGQGALSLKNSAFVGVVLDWTIWDWGDRGVQLDKAKSARRSATLAKSALEDAVTTDVRNTWLAADIARRTLSVAQSGLRAAEEAYRLQQVRVAEGAATTTDVIDAESEVARARSQETIARYQYLLKWMALARAVGETPIR